MIIKPLVSVIIPTYNRAKLLMSTLKSIINQTYTNIEVIVVDDGSEDYTFKMVNQIIDKRVKYFNVGRTKDIAKVRNIGISNSAGEFIAFCDDDDLWIRDKLEKQMKYATEFNFICTRSDTIDIYGNKINTNSCKFNKLIDIKDLLLGNQIITSSVLLNKNILSRGFIEKKSVTAAEDYELWLNLSLKNKIWQLGESLVLLRQHTNTSSFNYGTKYLAILNEVIKILTDYKHIQRNNISKYAIYGLVKQRNELCKLLFHNNYYKRLLVELLLLIKESFNPSFIKLFVKRKLFSFRKLC